MKAACVRLCCVLASVFFVLPLFSKTKERRENKTTITKSSNFTPYNAYQRGENNITYGEGEYTQKRVDIYSATPKKKRYETTHKVVKTRELVRSSIETTSTEPTFENKDKEATTAQTQNDVPSIPIKENNVKDTLVVEDRQEKSTTLPMSLFIQTNAY